MPTQIIYYTNLKDVVGVRDIIRCVSLDWKPESQLQTALGVDTLTGDIWGQAVDLTNRALAAISGINLPVDDDHWRIVVAFDLYQAGERLASVLTLLGRGYRDSADVLTRSLFEIAVNLSYIAKDVEQRLPEYLRHGSYPLSREDAEQILRKLSQESSAEMEDIVPRHAWKPLRAMCCDLGWLSEYERFYRYLSVVDHAGSFRIAASYERFLKGEPPSDLDKASVLLAALSLYLRVAELAATVFPTQIKAETITDLTAQCTEMGQFFAER
ncbi:MAG: DUF5677 domain-containing protein [Dehalococcoidia bacterium]